MAGLGAVVGSRLSTDAVAVVAGVVCGVLAGIPTAVLMLMIMRAQQRDVLSSSKGRGDERPAQPAQYPPVIVVGGAQPVPPAQLPPAREAGAVDGAWRELEKQRRGFRVIGEE